MNDIFKAISSRINNVFILSFAISWIFWNWPIVIGLVWYNSQTLNVYGYDNYKELIYANANIWKNYVYPFGLAFMYPFLKWGFNTLQTAVNILDEKTTKLITGNGYIPTKKFLDLRDQYQKNIQDLSNVISKESEVINENIKLKIRISEMETEISKISESSLGSFLNKIKNKDENTEFKDVDFNNFNSNILNNQSELISRSSKKVFVGKWNISITDSEDLDIELEINFDKSASKNAIMIGSDGKGNYVSISSYVFNAYANQVALHLQITNENVKSEGELYGKNMFFFGNLEWNNDYTVLSGVNHISFNEIEIRMVKIK